MKLNFHVHPEGRVTRVPDFALPPAGTGAEIGVSRTRVTRPSERGIALVITMIFVTVIAFMAITFLVLSYRERGSVSSTANQTDARLAAETALQRATAELLAPVMAFSNSFAYDLLVSTNYINPAGYVANNNFDPLNVSYNYANGVFLSDTAPNYDLQHNLANLLYDPRPPVFVSDPQTGNSDFRFYLDLNRNGRFDTNGLQPVIDNTGAATGNSDFFVGDPEWIGVLERPELPHSGNNKFIARYAFIAVPAGKTLDINYVHNYAKRGAVNMPFSTDDGYSRNQGVGSWEINLAAFLTDLNTNYWTPNGYSYVNGIGGGLVFDDALSLLRYRYNGLYSNLTNPVPLLDNGNIDEYANGDGAGQLMSGTLWNNDLNDSGSGYPGADNPTHFFSQQDLLTVPAGNFATRLQQASAQTDSYDRYTFYRLLSQLGTDSAPETGKLNLNYVNVDAGGNIVAGMETNFIPWAPLQFFTNAAAAMFKQLNLRDGYGALITVTNIPLYPTNYYTPAVHRVLQLAANFFDASTNGLYPSIYRPFFSVVNGTNYIISGYDLVNAPDDTTTPRPGDPYAATVFGNLQATPADLNEATGRTFVAANLHCNIYGVPWIVGAKKGFPNFNSVVLQSGYQITRKIRAVNTNPSGSGLGRFQFTQLFNLGVSNLVGVGVWNSYSKNYPRPVYIQADGRLTIQLTNDAPFGFPTIPMNVYMGGANLLTNMGAIDFSAGQWQGTGWSTSNPNNVNMQSFQVPLMTNIVFIPDYEYQQNPPGFHAPVGGAVDWSLNSPGDLRQPHWGLNVTNRIRCFILDGGPSGRVVDYVQLNDLNMSRDLLQEALADDKYKLWSTNRGSFGSLSNITQGVSDQLNIAAGNISVDDSAWNNMGGIGVRTKSIQAFSQFLGITTGSSNGISAMQVPISPTTSHAKRVSWQVNDPLVHFNSTDLKRSEETTSQINLYNFNDCYSPWNGSPIKDPTGDPYAWTIEVKDPGITSSDAWEFPTNKFPNVGWLGRVHRGTPWQTVYLKSSSADAAGWKAWSANSVNPQFSHPTNDWRLFDLFTTAPNANATRGQLSVAQTNLAAWSAVLSGVIVLTNDATTGITGPDVIAPAGGYDPLAPPPLVQIWQGINNARTNFANNSFNSLGDFLATPQLTMQSPYLNMANTNKASAGGLTDAIVERIPQQIMSLVRSGDQPRFVIYAYGQSLKPADHSIVQTGPSPGMCTNYQITGETALRAVVRVEGAPKKPRVILEQFNYLPPD